MRLVIIILLLFPVCTRSQTDFDILHRELQSLNKKGVDTAIIFGLACVDCDGSFISKYNLCYVLDNQIECRLVIINNNFFNSKKLYDSVYSCKDCDIIIKYATSHFKTIKNKIDSAGYIMAIKKTIGDTTYFRLGSPQGYCYFYGLYANKKLTYTQINSAWKIASLFKDGYECWVFINLLKDQWIQHVE